jgi:ABC-2 type transport system ATP-binding protein
MIEIRDLRVDYDDVCAVRDLTLRIGPGEVFGLIGPNGAGKTTTLRVLAGLLAPTYGEVLLDGIDLFLHHEAAIGRVGFMPDAPAFYDDLMVWEFLDLFAHSYGIPADRRPLVIDDHLALVGLTEKREAMTGSLSRGMQQRLMLAKTLLADPQILLLDEPASGMDPYGRALLRDLLRQLGAAGKAVVISSHILTELADMCTSLGIMEKGRMVIAGRVEDVAVQVLGGHEIYLELLEGADRLAALLADTPGAGAPQAEGEGFVFSFSGDQAAIGELLGRLVAAGLPVVAFGRRKRDLEEVFLAVGAREVS